MSCLQTWVVWGARSASAVCLLAALGCGGGGAGGPPAASVFDLGLLSSTRQSRASIRVTNPLAGPAVLTDLTHVTGVRVDPTVLPMPAAAGELLTVPLVFAPLAPGPVDFAVALCFTGGGQTVVREVTVRVKYEAVTWRLTPPMFNFGSVQFGQQPERSVRVWNQSTVSPVTISTVSLSSANHVLVSPSLPLTIGPGALAEFVMRYQPAAAGLHSGTLVLGPGDPSAQLIVPILTGDLGVEGEFVLDLGPVAFTAGEASPIPFEVPSDTVSITAEIRGDESDEYRVAELMGPGGESYVPVVYYADQLPAGTGQRIYSYTFPDSDVPARQLVTGGGTFAVRFRLLQGFGGAARARVILERRPGALVPDGRLDLNVWLGKGLAINASTAAADPAFNVSLARLSAALASAGITLGDLDFYDITDPVFDDTTFEELPALFASSRTATSTRINVFLLAQAGFNGYSAALGGPRANGTHNSGVVVNRTFFPNDDVFGVVMAHEIGHYFGLYHGNESFDARALVSDGMLPNLMSDFTYTVGTFTNGQGYVMRRHPHVQPVVGASKPGVAPATHALPPGALPPPATWCAHCAQHHAR